MRHIEIENCKDCPHYHFYDAYGLDMEFPGCWLTKTELDYQIYDKSGIAPNCPLPKSPLYLQLKKKIPPEER